MHRRKFIVHLGALAALPQLPETGRLGMSDIARIRHAEDRLSQLDNQYGSAQLADVAARYAEHVEHAMRHCVYGSRVQIQLHQALAEMWATAGWLCYDSGRHEQARHYWDTALRYALLARDPMLQARVWSGMARQAVDLGHGAEAVAVARAALDATRGRRDRRLSALLHTRVALGHSVQGERGLCGRSLLYAEQDLDRVTGDAPGWLDFCGPQEVTGQTALCFYNLGDYERAARADHESLILMPAEFRRNQFATHVSLARNLLAAGELDGALISGSKALDLMPEVKSPRWAAHLTQLRNHALRRSPSMAADFADRYREAGA